MVRVRLFELRLLAVALTALWAAGGGVVLIAYRPGGPLDMLVGISASLPLLVSVASIVWPPLVRSNRGSAGVFWLGLVAGLMLIPSIAAVTSQVLSRRSQPLLPSAEVIYPWAFALLATGLYAGLGVSRQFVAENGIGRKRAAVAIAFALATTSTIGVAFAGVSLADDAALRNMPAAHSRFGPTAVLPIPPNCDDPIVGSATAQLELGLQGYVDGRGIGTVDLTGARSGTAISWMAQVVRSDLFGQYGAVRTSGLAWTLAPHAGWNAVTPSLVDKWMVDQTAVDEALNLGNRATAEDRGLEFVEGARARRCRVAIDGDTFSAAFPEVAWLLSDASMKTWRGELDYWVFGDGQVGMVTGSINGDAQLIVKHGIQATIYVQLTATDRGQPVAISPPRT
jgi:hypothetical protein